MNKLYFLLFFFAICSTSKAQDSLGITEEKIIIGLTEAPPFVMKNGGNFSGLSVESWKLVNRQLDTEYEFREFPNLESLLQAVEQGSVDLSINPITVTDQRMQRMDFSQPYFISYTGIARQSGSSVWRYLSNIFSWNFFSAILILVGVIFIFGLLVWIFERKKNKEEFGPGAKGILQGFWWSAVTMTTVGYGDKSPRTFGGRFIGFIWMFMAIIMISTLTAGIASSLTVQNIQDDITSVQDLERFNVYTVKSSSAQELLEQYGINPSKISSADEGLEALLENNNNVLVYDKPILSYRIEEKGLVEELAVLENTLKKDYYSYSFPDNSDLLDKINPILIGTLKSMEWNSLISEYK
ncbi:transporter substrate-binding domain-containing protein [Salinimicrobium sediminilitoris]|uniref:transporter substrate-binding domain-containing protein n=1 Tax=Salinimicrobium sediminilitoris TaxID=2876715 RepID=UPI001E5441B9|nr:transporter substrate-binding domain-containing protein [Salinimicrobium sediminilitoris]MCC8359493.1 transporter substrate-binding domain-containing protein [Salinimicrobium sediminilitoris]